MPLEGMRESCRRSPIESRAFLRENPSINSQPLRGGPMKRSLAVLLIVFVPLIAARADEKDDWTGEWVLPRKQEVPICDADGKPLGTWSVNAGKVLSTEKTRLRIRQSQGRGPFEGYVSKTDVVKLADAVAFFSNAIRADGKSSW